jgi:LPXTG-motif cell wall-anchored protein
VTSTSVAGDPVGPTATVPAGTTVGTLPRTGASSTLPVAGLVVGLLGLALALIFGRRAVADER